MRVTLSRTDRRRRVASVCLAGTCATAVFVLLWRAGGVERLGALSGNVPMAPGAALFFVALSGAALGLLRRPNSPAVTIAGYLAVLVTSTLSLLVLVQAIVASSSPVGDRLSTTAATVAEIPSGTMPPSTAVAFALAALALWHLLKAAAGRLCRRRAAILAFAVVLISLAAAVSYILKLPFVETAQAPLMDGWAGAPMALATSVAMLLLGVGLMLSAGADVWPLDVFSSLAEAPPSARRVNVGLMLFALLLAAGLGAGGYRTFTQQRTEIRHLAEESLVAIASLKEEAVAAWFRDRMRDAEVARQQAMIGGAVEAYLSAAPGGRGEEDLRAWIHTLQQRHDYGAVGLFDADGELRLSALASGVTLEPRDADDVERVLADGGVVLEGLHQRAQGPGVSMSFLIPMSNSGMLVLQVDPSRVLFPLVQKWPAPSATAETLLVRRDGNDVVVLNELRHREATGVQILAPINATSALPASMVFFGVRGAVQGPDYRGVPVMAAVGMVSGTPWALVTKIDQDETLEPLRRQVRATSALVALFLLAAMTGSGWLWNRERLASTQRELVLVQQRELSDQKLRESEAQFRTTLEAVPDMILRVDGKGTFLEWKAARDSARYPSPEGFLGRPIAEVLPAGVARRARAAIRRALASDTTQIFEYELEVDGITGHFEGRVARSGADEAVWIVRDITEQRRAAELLRLSEERFRLAILGAPLPAMIHAEDGEVLAVNRVWTDVSGYSVEDIPTIGEWTSKAYGEGRRVERGRISELFRSDAPTHEGEFVIRTRAGESRCWDFHSSPLGRTADGRRFVLSMAVDTTEQVRAAAKHQLLETQLQQSKKLEAVGRLAGGVAHDFNNMLAVILGNAELAMSDALPGQKGYESLEEIREAAMRSAALTRQLLAFARKQTISPRILDLNATISEMLKMLRRLLGEDLALVWTPGDSLWPVTMDPSQVDQILANLSVNARDAMAGSGELTIATDNVELDAAACTGFLDLVPGEYVQLTVQDTGHGIDEATMGRLFEPFFTTKELGAGSGLGLATVYGIVGQNGGNIEVRSTPGEGTTFSIYLPRARGRPIARQPQRSESLSGVEHVLVVEDESQILDLCVNALERSGYTVTAAHSGEEAVALIEDTDRVIDVLVTDVIMPGMGGKRLREKLTAARPSLKTLFMSGYPADLLAQRGVLGTDVELLTKPFSMTELTTRVRVLLDS